MFFTGELHVNNATMDGLEQHLKPSTIRGIDSSIILQYSQEHPERKICLHRILLPLFLPAEQKRQYCCSNIHSGYTIVTVTGLTCNRLPLMTVKQRHALNSCLPIMREKLNSSWCCFTLYTERGRIIYSGFTAPHRHH